MPDEIVVIPPPAITVDVYAGQPGARGPGPTNEQLAAVIPAAAAYNHNQISASTTWTITHNLHFNPNVTVFDSSGAMVEGHVSHTSVDALTVTFSAAISGQAVLS